MPNTFTLIASSTVGAGGAANIDFTSIPSTYTDLCLKLSARGDGAAFYQNCKIEFNGATTGNTYRTLLAVAGTPESGSSTGNAYPIPAATATSSTFGNTEFYLPNYAGSTNKSFSVDAVTENNSTSVVLGFTANLWSNTAAITSIKLSTFSGNFVQYSTAYLYGIVKS